jgi:hypothetical protein
MLKRENTELENKLKIADLAAEDEIALKKAVSTLEEELRHIKRHYETQISDLRH